MSTVTLRALLSSIAGGPPPHRSQMVWIIDCPDPQNDDYVEAIANSVCELEDKLRNRSGVFFSTTAILFSVLEEFTSEDVLNNWAEVILHVQRNLVEF
jgi:hypothetical protein